VTQLTTFSADYVDQQDGISTRSQGRALVQNNDFVGVASYNIFIGIAVATIFGSGFFFDLFWPERHESESVKLAWKICSVVISIMAFADALAMTVCYKLPRIINQMHADYLDRLLWPRIAHISQGSLPQKPSFISSRMANRTRYTGRMQNVLHR